MLMRYFTLKEILDGKGLSKVGIQSVVVNFGFKESSLGFVGFWEFYDQEGIRYRNNVEIS